MFTFQKNTVKKSWFILFVVMFSFTTNYAQDSTVTPTPAEPVEKPTPQPSPTTNENNAENNTQNNRPVSNPTAPPATNNPTPIVNQPTTPSTSTTNNQTIPTTVEEAPKDKPEIEQQIDLNNPFELVDYGTERPKEEVAEGNVVRDTAIRYNNPFELVENGRIAMLTLTDGQTVTSKKRKKKAKKRRKKRAEPLFDNKQLDLNAIIKFLVLLVIGLFLAFLNTSYRRDIQKIYRAFTNNNLMMQLYREKGSLLDMPYIPLYVLFCFTLGAFIFLVLGFYNANLGNPVLSILACMSGVAGFYLMKHLILKTISIIFPFKKEIHEYHFTLGIFNQIIGLALIPLVTIIAFAPENIKLIAIYGAYLTITLILFQRLLRVLLIGQKFIAFHTFHLIVYLCTVEIAPILIILKLIMG